MGLFAQAAYVLTDSFHGTVFSINFGRPFHAFSYEGGGKARVSSRLKNILGMLGLTERLLTSEADRISPATALSGFDQQKVRAALDGERTRSLAWLAAALKGERCGGIGKEEGFIRETERSAFEGREDGDGN